MLNDLKFAAGAVARKDFVPELQHFQIANGRIYGYDGKLAISTPTDLTVSCVPKASSLIKAMEKVENDTEIVLNFTQSGRLSVKAGKARFYIDCLDGSAALPRVDPEGQMIALPNVKLIPLLELLYPFISIDASRPWSRGVLLRGQSAYATNNIVIVQHWMPVAFPADVNIPAEAVKEMIRIGVEPTHIQVAEKSATFHYPSGAWVRTGLGETQWPDLARVLDRPADAKPFHPEFFDGVRQLSSFVDKENRLYLRGGTLATHEEEGKGACIDLDDFGGVGCHYLKQMSNLEGVAQTIDFSMYPAPCIFYGNMLRGAIVGLRMNDAV